MNSIDYGMGKTNIDVANGIRFGVISQHEVTQAWCDSSEADYGQPTCPKCGNCSNLETDNDVSDYSCENCEYNFSSDQAYGDEPIAHTLDDGEYKATQGDHDIFIIKSPYFTLCEYCSPCAPGAGYLMNEGSVKAYCFGHDWFEDGKAPYKVFSVATGEEVLA